jgi:HSP20 family protein
MSSHLLRRYFTIPNRFKLPTSTFIQLAAAGTRKNGIFAVDAAGIQYSQKECPHMAEEEKQRKLARGEEQPAAPARRMMEEHPWQMMRRMRDDINRLFWQFGMPTPVMEPMRPSLAVDMWETESDVKVRADLPGVDPKDLDVTLLDDTLTIKGQVKHEEEVEEEGYYSSERRYGSFQRQILIPTPVQEDKIRAVYKRGVLDITLPKQEEAKAKAKRVQIESEEKASQSESKRQRKK